MPKAEDRKNWDLEPHGGSASEGTFPGCDISGEELEFMKALDRYKRERRRPFPTWAEVLWVAKSIGWLKVADAVELPTFRKRRRNRPGGGPTPKLT